jgi:hypothetical protein
MTWASAIDEINGRILEAGVGYQFASGEIIRLDSQFLHSEVVRPLLSHLSDRRFASANHEFLEAHRLYREGDHEKTLIECCKSLESVLKIIGAYKGWVISQNASARSLLEAAFTNGLVPEYLQGEFTALRALLESGVPTVRNRSSGHGAGAIRRVVPRHLAAFQLHQTAAAMLFLVDAARLDD